MIALQVIDSGREFVIETNCHDSFPILCSTARRIEQYLDRIWPVPPVVAAAKVSFEMAVQLNRYDIFERAEARRLIWTAEQVDSGAFARYCEYLKARKTDDATYDDVNTLVFESGLCELLPADKVLRDRATLRTLLRALSFYDQPFDILDLGCGDARTALGISGYLCGTEKIRAVDCNRAALARALQNEEKIVTVDNRLQSGILQVIAADFLATPIERLTGKAPELVLALYPFRRNILDEFQPLVEQFDRVLDDRNAALIAAPVFLSREGESVVIDVLRTWKSIADSRGLEVNLLNAETYFGDQGFVICEIKRAGSRFSLTKTASIKSTV